MDYLEWLDSVGGNVSALSIIRERTADDQDEIDALAERGRQIADSGGEFVDIFRQMVAAYHEYICAFIRDIEEQRHA